jgi:hypothetical protein
LDGLALGDSDAVLIGFILGLPKGICVRSTEGVFDDIIVWAADE